TPCGPCRLNPPLPERASRVRHHRIAPRRAAHCCPRAAPPRSRTPSRHPPASPPPPSPAHRRLATSAANRSGREYRFDSPSPISRGREHRPRGGDRRGGQSGALVRIAAASVGSRAEPNALDCHPSARSCRTTAFLPIRARIGERTVVRRLAADSWQLRAFCCRSCQPTTVYLSHSRYRNPSPEHHHVQRQPSDNG